MEVIKKYENYPIGIVVLSNLVSIAMFGLGFMIILRLGRVFSVLYLLYILTLELRLIKNHCTSCYYWGKTCGFGKGRISSLFFKKENASKFCAKGMTWRDMVPDLLVSLIPLVTGIILLILKFEIILLTALLLLLLLTTVGNGFVRGSLTCKHCKQKDLGCPAYLLFDKKK